MGISAIDPKLAAAGEELRHLLVWIAYVDLQYDAGLHRLAKMRFRKIRRDYEALRQELVTLFQSEEYGQKFDFMADEKVDRLKEMATIQGTARLLAMMQNDEQAA